MEKTTVNHLDHCLVHWLCDDVAHGSAVDLKRQLAVAVQSRIVMPLCQRIQYVLLTQPTRWSPVKLIRWGGEQAIKDALNELPTRYLAALHIYFLLPKPGNPSDGQRHTRR